MKTKFLLLAILISIKGLAQTELAKINDPDGYTNVRIDKGLNCEIIDKFSNGDLFLCTPSSEDWWLVRKYNFKEGYIHKSRVTLIKSLSDPEIKKIIIIGLDTLNKKNLEFINTPYSSNLDLYSLKRKEIESFTTNIFWALLKYISQQFCKSGDPVLLDKYLKALIINQNSADEMAPMTLGECYICYPDIVIQHIDRLPNKDRLVLIEDLNFGFREAIYQEEDNIKNIKLLTDKLDTWIKKAKL